MLPPQLATVLPTLAQRLARLGRQTALALEHAPRLSAAMPEGCPLTGLLDAAPLKPGQASSSLLTAFSYSSAKADGAAASSGPAAAQAGAPVHVDRGLLTLARTLPPSTLAHSSLSSACRGALGLALEHSSLR